MALLCRSCRHQGLRSSRWKISFWLGVDVSESFWIGSLHSTCSDINTRISWLCLFHAVRWHGGWVNHSKDNRLYARTWHGTWRAASCWSTGFTSVKLVASVEFKGFSRGHEFWQPAQLWVFLKLQQLWTFLKVALDVVVGLHELLSWKEQKVLHLVSWRKDIISPISSSRWMVWLHFYFG